MTVYLSNPYGTIPGEPWREYRFYLLAKALVEEGHEVIWFTSTFSHHFKTQRSPESKILKVQNNLSIHLIKSTSYKKNFSLGRVYRDFIYGINLYSILKKGYSKPDIFICGDSPLTFYFPSYFYCRQQNIPYVLDQMDLWPELVIDSVSKQLKPVVNFAFLFHFWFRNLVYNNASGFISLAKKYYEIPLQYSSNLAKIPHAVIYNGINIKEYQNFSNNHIFDFENELPNKSINDIWYIFAGTLGPSYDLKTMIYAFDQIEKKFPVKLIIAGDGSERDFIVKYIATKAVSNIIYVGKLSKQELIKLYSLCDVGLNAYGKYSNVEMSDKFYDYTAAGLAIINSLTGEVADLISVNNIGTNYISGAIDSFKHAIQLYIHNIDLLNNHKKNSAQIAIEFDQQNQLNRFKQFWKNLECSL
jgi:glycosyltransferase involved in cell wall biosynthesis